MSWDRVRELHIKDAQELVCLTLVRNEYWYGHFSCPVSDAFAEPKAMGVVRWLTLMYAGGVRSFLGMKTFPPGSLHIGFIC